MHVKSVLTWAVTHPQAVIDGVTYCFWAVGYLLAHGVIKSKRVEAAYKFGVAAAEQWKRQRTKAGEKVEPAQLRDKAVGYILGKLGARTKIDETLLESMVYMVTHKPAVPDVPTTTPVGGGE